MIYNPWSIINFLNDEDDEDNEFKPYWRAQITERSRRGKRHRAKSGLVNVLSGAPYGYRYVKKTDCSPASYEVIEREAEVVREVYRLFTGEGISIGAITRQLNHDAIPTRRGQSRWERSAVWSMLKYIV
ncbi:MAG: recombinase family protein [Acidobacteria bacterium]|nr:recombinase family protein [Acidobacteriota bacterium]